MRVFAVLLHLAFLLNFRQALSQPNTPVEYMSNFSDLDEELAKGYLGYITAVNHGRSARKMEKRRTELLKTIKEAQQDVAGRKAFGRDVSLRDAYAKYYTILLLVLTQDYGKIVNLEEIAEQSYDNMEAYLMAREKAGEKLDSAGAERQTAYRQFAKKNNVRLIEAENRVSKKLEQSSRVNSYYNQLYLIFFKSNKQEYYLVEPFNKSDLNAIEQSKSTQIRYAREGLQKLAVIKSFDNDYSVVAACRKMLEFYKMESEQKVPLITSYFLKNNEFDKTKKIYDAKPAQDRTDADINAYNKMVTEINKASSSFNQINKELNANRNALIDQWNNAVGKFLDSHTPSR